MTLRNTINSCFDARAGRVGGGAWVARGRGQAARLGHEVAATAATAFGRDAGGVPGGLGGPGDPSAAPNLPRVILIGSLFINLLGLALPLVMLQVYDRILPNDATETLAYFALGMVVVVGLDTAMKMARAYLVGWVTMNHHVRLLNEALSRLVHAPAGLLQDDAPSVYFDRVNALDTLRDFHGGQARLLLLDLPFTVVFLGLVAVLGHWLVLVPITLFVVLGSVAVRRSGALRAVAEQRAGHDDQRHDFIMESLSGIESIKAMAMEPQIQRRFERLQQVGVKASHDAILLGNEAQNGGNLFSSLTMISVVTVGALMVIGGSLSMGTLAACTLLSGRTIQPLLRGLDLWTQIQSLSVTRRRVCSLFELPEAPAMAAPVVNCTGVIAVRNLGFAHAPDRPAVFSNLDLDVAAGEFLGLRGGDGVGKSTLLSLLRGDLVPSRGEVRIDGYDPSGPHRAALGAMVASVPQSAELFRGTILENITLFRTGEAIDSAREAARLIGLEAIIHHLPEGYDTMVGEGVSSTLPDGLCQRIAIARALAGRPKILLFDEANSALDVKSDRLLREGLATLKGRMTVILASQRPSLLRIADRIVVLRDGALHAASADLDEVPRDTAPAQRLAAS